MIKVKVSPKYQVLIPKQLREETKIRPGQELYIYALDGTLCLDPRRSLKALRGMAKGMKWRVDDRDHTDRF
jgi:AbrB family looped-hinge helix DNA binding protein